MRNNRRQNLFDNRPKYLKYRDVFMTPRDGKQQPSFARSSTNTISNREQQYHSIHNMPQDYSPTSAYNESRYQDTDGTYKNSNSEYNDYDQQEYIIPNRGDIMDEQMIRYKKRQLPPLHNYDLSNRNYNRNTYWNEYDQYQGRESDSKYRISFQTMWQKFIMTFTSILSLVCLTWIAYNWHNNKNTTNRKLDAPELIEPERPSFKVLPDTPGVAPIPYQDKSIYNRIDPEIATFSNERMIPPQDLPDNLPPEKITRSTSKTWQAQNKSTVEEYSIIDDRVYYIKYAVNKDKQLNQKQLSFLRKKLADFSGGDVLEGVDCAIKTVVNPDGKRGSFILIGPFDDYSFANEFGRFCRIDGEIISVKKVNKRV